jgi:CRP/FNR family transcriptional regulator, cyclic AMP receptor protein
VPHGFLLDGASRVDDRPARRAADPAPARARRARTRGPAADRYHPAGTVQILDHLPDLAEDLTESERRDARRWLLAPSAVLASGPCEMMACSADARVAGRLLGLLVVEGLIATETVIGRRCSLALHGPGDLVTPQLHRVDPVEGAAAVRCPDRAVVALLDDRVLLAAHRWPRLVGRLFEVAMRQLGEAYTSVAISQLRSVEDRLLALFWHLADGWGRRRADVIAIRCPLTHAMIGQLIGAERPTVSVGLAALAERGLLERRDGEWRLAPGSLQRLRGAAEEPCAAED